MSGFAEWEIDPAMAAGLEHLGWRADDAEVRDAVPAVLRGSNVVALLPPAPAWAGPVIGALLGRSGDNAGPVLLLTAPSMIAEWAIAVGALAEGTTLRIEVARAAGTRASSASPLPPDLLIASPETALDRHVRSALHPERFRAVVFAWPEEWHADETVTMLLQDVDRDAQRIVLTARGEAIDGAGGVVERYARKSLVLKPATVEAGTPAPVTSPSVRAAATTWSGRAATAAAVLDAIDPMQATIWTADERDHQLIRRTLGSLRPGISVSSRTIPDAGTVICYDPPTAQQLSRLGAAGEVLLLVAPGTESHAARIAPSRRPMLLSSPGSAAADRDALLRTEIGRVIDAGDDSAALYALGPLFEEHDAQRVAAALFRLWRRAGEASGATSRAPVSATVAETSPAPVTSPATGNPRIAKVWIGAGKRDEATVADFVAVLVREVGLERSRIGRIELRDTFALVEVPAEEAEAIALRLGGVTIRKRKLTARVDRGRDVGPRGSKPPSRGGASR